MGASKSPTPDEGQGPRSWSSWLRKIRLPSLLLFLGLWVFEQLAGEYLRAVVAPYFSSAEQAAAAGSPDPWDKLKENYKSEAQGTDRYQWKRVEYLYDPDTGADVPFGHVVDLLTQEVGAAPVLITGEVGVGKTTMRKRLVRRILDDSPDNLQVAVADLSKMNPDDIDEYSDGLKTIAKLVDVPEDALNQQRRDGLILLLDGIGRLNYTHHAAAAKMFKNFISESPGLTVVLISQSGADFHENLDLAGLNRFILPALTVDEAKAYMGELAGGEDSVLSAFDTWLKDVDLSQTFEQFETKKQSLVYMSTFDDAKVIFQLFKENTGTNESPRIGANWTIADLTHDFILDSVLKRDDGLTARDDAKVAQWLDAASFTTGTDNRGISTRVPWQRRRCQQAAADQGLPSPEKRCERLFVSNQKGGVKFLDCTNKQVCKLYHAPQDQLFRARAVAREVKAAGSCASVVLALRAHGREGSAMLVGQKSIRDACLPEILESLCAHYGSTASVAEHVRKGFPVNPRSRQRELTAHLREIGHTSSCARGVIEVLAK